VSALPQRLGPYLLEAELGRGAMGVVYRARDTRVDRVVAIKLVLTEGQVQAQRFELEARAAARLRHKNLVAVHDLSIEGNRVYLVSEFVPGRSLQALLKEQGRFEPERAVELLARLCDGVEHAHQADVIHRDIKPDNVLLADEEPRLADFGIARIDTGGMTKTGQLLGTPSFMPPEQAGGERDRIGPRSDVYSLGATLYALLTGQPPFSAGSPYATVTAVLTKEPQPPSELAPIPPELDAIVLRALAKEPDERYQSAAALGQALEDWQRGVAHEDVRRGQGKAKRVVFVAGALIVMAAAAAAAWFGKRAFAPPTLAKPPTPTPSPSSRPNKPGLGGPLGDAKTLWSDPDRLDPDAALAAYAKKLEDGVEGAIEPLSEILTAGHGDEPLRKSALAALEHQATSGSEAALLALARVLTKGRSANPEAAQAYCAELKARGQGRGLLWLGDYWKSRGDTRQAEIFYLAAKEAGDQEGRVRLGELLILRGSRKDEGLIYLAAAEGERIASASKAMGDAYRYSRGVERDLAKSEHHYRQAIRRGSLEASFQLATLLRYQNKNYRPLLEETARKGHAQAAAELSRLLIEADPARALRLTRFAASRGYALATVWLAEHYFQGQGVERDAQRGWEILRVASSRLNARACCALGTRLQGQGQVSEARALWREQVEEDQDTEAAGLLAASLLDHEPKPEDTSEAKKLLHQAADKAEPNSAIRLARAYEEGPSHPLGLEVDLARALKYYLLGARGRDASKDVARINNKILEANLKKRE
jgi:serine/threonine protein kinase